eukprot:jgi/Mesvir1/13207/Mv06166-RA.1
MARTLPSLASAAWRGLGAESSVFRMRSGELRRIPMMGPPFLCRGLSATATTVGDTPAATQAATEPAQAGKEETAGKGSQAPPPRWRKSPVNWASAALLLCTAAGLVAYYDYLKGKKMAVSAAKLAEKSVGTAAIGGPFTLTDHNGKGFTEKDLLGKFSVLYFGFTHCPDICPDELLKLADALDIIEKQTHYQVTPVFISVDPERDSVEHVREWVKEFHPRLIGLTGSPDQVKAAARAYRVYYVKASEAGASSDDYLIDHSIVMYLLDPEGNFVTFFGKNHSAESIAEQISQYIARWKKK